MTDIKAVIFDIGGVLTNVNRDRAVRNLVDEGLDPTAVFALMNEAFNSPDGANPFHRAERGEISLTAVLEWADDRVPGASRALNPSSEFYVAGDVTFTSEMLTVAKAARRRGLRVGALSNAIREWVEASSDEAALTFYRSVSPVVFSCDIGVRKPAPEAFERMLALLDSTATETVFVDDSEINCEAAASLGLRVIHVTDASADAARVADALGLAPPVPSSRDRAPRPE